MTDLERQLLVTRALGGQERVMHGLLAQADSDPWLHLEMSMAQCKAMLFLCQQGAVTISHVAEGLGIGRPAASNLVERLVQQGVAQRDEDPDDRRKSLASLTPAGADLAARLQQMRVTQLRRYLGKLSDEDLAALVRGVEALADAILSDEPSVPQILETLPGGIPA
jgi:DNA-binding MarR family transcriptional regulator